MRYVHTNIISNDWKKLAKFYIEVLACRLIPPVRHQKGSWLEKGTGLPDAKLEGAHLLLPGWGDHGPTLEIHQYDTIEPLSSINPNRQGFAHIAFEVEDVEAVLGKIEAAGGSANGQISQNYIEGVGEITFVYARDPEGNLVEIQHWNKS